METNEVIFVGVTNKSALAFSTSKLFLLITTNFPSFLDTYNLSLAQFIKEVSSSAFQEELVFSLTTKLGEFAIIVLLVKSILAMVANALFALFSVIYKYLPSLHKSCPPL